MDKKPKSEQPPEASEGTKPASLPGSKPAGATAAKPASLPGSKSAGAKPAGSPPGTGRPAMPPGAKPPGSRPPGARPPSIGKTVGGDGGPGSPGLTRKDFTSDQEVRWCPGCGDYSILAQVQRLMPEFGVDREKTVFISGIGCSSRFPYYMNTYGFHSIHGRAPTLATGLKASRPELDVWIVTGDGDALSIGGNHFIHLLRRNLDVKILLFNNQIYGLTKGQYSPTSEIGKITGSSPYGSIDHPFNPLALALGADATFVARTMDRDPKHLQDIIKEAHGHRGSSFIEVYQNCNIFNDGAFFEFTERDTKASRALFLEKGKPMVFDQGKKGIGLDGSKLRVLDLEGGNYSIDDCLVHDPEDESLAILLGRIFWDPEMPRPFGVFYRQSRPTYDELMQDQMDSVTTKKGKGALQALLNAGEVWEV